MVRNISGKRSEYKNGGGSTLNSRKGFGFGIRKSNGRPSNTSTRDLLGNEIFTDTVLVFPRDARVGMVKERVLDKD